MDQVFRYEIPVLHPILVHFPVVLVFVAAIFVLLWLLSDRVASLVTGAWILSAAFIMTIGAYLTGEEMEERSEGVPIVDTLVELHEGAALVSMIVIALALLSLVSVFYTQRRDKFSSGSQSSSRLWTRIAVFILVLLAVVSIWWTAHIGGTMVWGTVR